MEHRHVHNSYRRTRKFCTYFFVLISQCPNLDWIAVAESFDHPSFRINEPEALQMIQEIFSKNSFVPFPNEVFLQRKWHNAEGQWSLVKFACESESWVFPPSMDVLTALEGIYVTPPTTTAAQTVLTPPMLSSFPASTLSAQKQAILALNFCSLSLVSCLIRLSADVNQMYPDLKALFAEGMKVCPVIVLFSLCLAKDQNSPLKKEITNQLMLNFLPTTGVSTTASHQSSSLLLGRVWEMDRDTVVDSMVSMYTADPSTLSRILNVAQDLKVHKITADFSHTNLGTSYNSGCVSTPPLQRWPSCPCVPSGTSKFG